MNPFHRFQNTYCINLHRRTDRYEQSLAEFNRLGINVTYFPGIEKQDGKLGCKLSHLALFKLAYESGWPDVVIFEDDVQFIGDTLQVLTQALDQVGGDFDMMYLGATINAPMVYHTPNTYRISGAYATQALIIKRRILPRLIAEYEATTPILSLHDWNDVILSRLQLGIVALVTNPMIAIQRPGFSDILQGEQDYTYMMEKFEQYKPEKT